MTGMKPHEYYAIGDEINDLEVVAMVMRQEDFFFEATIIDAAIDTLMELREAATETF